ncbi:MAG: pilus assembly protein N-terminal domain-containing protein, partial [Alphaproteobacteria bacterium]|nr:pilus assembly protein N-terminal domain-containing protein [Alphaproteobacteria bacterium]
MTTNEDNFVEPEEYFSATLSLPGSPDTVVIGSPDVAFVTIIDERGSGLRESLIHLITKCSSTVQYNAHLYFLYS